ncbi:GGDEF domain-containing protein [Aureimonas populi]|uniref:Diguanylate cyclase DosC n=1 Tax=Aureimonas populi TaxID=1701758 RepID=A0ABW5CLG5_9HYPH|nr:GGDEF domain-containing protein [Aureimonas populi]
MFSDQDGSAASRRTGETAPVGAREALLGIIEGDAEELVASFYRTFLKHEEAANFLSHSVVQERLSHSLCRWLRAFFRDEPDDTEFAARQKHIGEVHARIKIPIHLVLEGASLVKSGIARRLPASSLTGEEMAAVLILLDERVDLAMRLMSEAYFIGTRQRAQVDEAYRLFSLGQDISMERESQRAALMEWSQSALFGLFGGQGNATLKPISASSFGLWLRHRAGMMFQGAAALDPIEGIMQQIDSVLLPKIADTRTGDASGLPQAVERLQAAIEEINFLLAELFQGAAALENGRDPLTRTLNRRFLPSILSREISLATTSGAAFCVLMIDIDHFKRINDQGGHSAGDLVLRQIADVILDSVRQSDFVFRYGGEEFLVALVETRLEDAVRLAERIRKTFTEQSLRLPDGGELTVTASIGVAAFDGHPDHAYLVNAADKALYRAKEMGRNRVETALPSDHDAPARQDAV